jgi:hypothetical protein
MCGDATAQTIKQSNNQTIDAGWTLRAVEQNIVLVKSERRVKLPPE